MSDSNVQNTLPPARYLTDTMVFHLWSVSPWLRFAGVVTYIGCILITLSGIVEATLRKPRIIDTQTISDDVGSIKGIYRNRITKALLVFFLSSIGGAIGNFISIPSLAGLLTK